MAQLAGYENVFLATFLLLLLALLTIEACRRDHVSVSTDTSIYLFRGRLPIHSLASNIGATFSLTYFFGAIVIYAQLFQSWAIVILSASFPVVCFLYQRLLKRAEAEIPPEEMVEQRGNILLALLRKSLSDSSFRAVSAIYLITYFGLLVEELAVSRVVLSSLIPNRPVVVALLLSLICLVVVVYLYLGGFRAVLISDFVQGAVLCSFFLMLAFLTVRHGTADQLINFPRDHPLMRASNLGFVGFLALAWFLAGVDYSARFNFDSKDLTDLKRKRRKLVILSAILSLGALSLGILFSQALSKEIPATTTPTEYVSALAIFFLVKSAPALRIVFLVSVHCMIFTTLDTLLVTMLQISQYREPTLIDMLFFRRDRLLHLLLAASVASCLINKDHVHIVGIFIASLLCILVIPCSRVLFPGLTRWLPDEPSYLWWSLLLASGTFAILERRIIDAFDYHFLLPGLVLASLVLALAARKSWDIWKKVKPS